MANRISNRESAEPSNALRAQTTVPEMMSTTEVADYLRISERTVYDLLKDKKIPSSRVTGKWLFPKKLIDRWVAQHTEYSPAKTRDIAPIVAGSHDPLLEWALRESRSGLAMMASGSVDGLRRVVEGEAIAAGTHLIDPESGEYNRPFLRAHYAQSHVVLIHWAERTQGLIMRREDEKKLTSIAKLKSAKTRVVLRQPESGGFHLFNHLLATASVPTSSLNIVDAPALTDTDLAQRIRDGEGDVGLGCEASALGAGLAFVPLAKERFDVLMRRRDFFEPPLQALFVFARGAAFRKRAEQLGGYDVSHTGSVVFNP